MSRYLIQIKAQPRAEPFQSQDALNIIFICLYISFQFHCLNFIDKLVCGHHHWEYSASWDPPCFPEKTFSASLITGRYTRLSSYTLPFNLMYAWLYIEPSAGCYCRQPVGEPVDREHSAKHPSSRMLYPTVLSSWNFAIHRWILTVFTNLAYSVYLHFFLDFYVVFLWK